MPGPRNAVPALFPGYVVVMLVLAALSLSRDP